MHPFAFLLMTEAATRPQGWEALVQANLPNFIAALLIMAFVINKLKVGQTIDSSRQKVVDEIHALEAARKEAEQNLAQIKARTANLQQEVAGILADAKASAETLSGQIIQDARTDAAKIIDNAKRRIEMEQKASAKELERRLLTDALSDARLELAQQVNADDQKRSVEAFIRSL